MAEWCGNNRFLNLNVIVTPVTKKDGWFRERGI